MTDANLLLGYLATESVLAGKIKLDRELAEKAIAELAKKLRLSLEACAEGIVTVANHEMLRALRAVTVERGIDPRRHVLICFGGAGPMHGAMLADELAIDTVLCPRAAGVLSALGLVVSKRRRDLAKSVLLADSELKTTRMAEVVEALASKARDEIGQQAEISAAYDLRYRGQAFELSIPGAVKPSPKDLRRDFEEAHCKHYGYADPEGVLELVTVRVTAELPGAQPNLGGSDLGGEVNQSTRGAIFGGNRLDTVILRGRPQAETKQPGPAIFEMPEATVVVPPKWNAQVDQIGTVLLSKVEQ